MITLLVVTFILGYLVITLEHPLRIPKAAAALITGSICWVLVHANDADSEHVLHLLSEQLSETAAIAFFLMCAMTIVELIDAHGGFEVITSRIHTRHRMTVLWLTGGIAFFMSAVLDNLTTTIVMIALMRALLTKREDRLLAAGVIIIAANAGGVWSPVGDVTTTMLWIGNRITTWPTVRDLFIPACVSLLVPLIYLSWQTRAGAATSSAAALAVEDTPPAPETHSENRPSLQARERWASLLLGIGAFIGVPVFKSVTHLPPYLGILLGLGLIWVAMEFLHRERSEEDRDPFTIRQALHRIDMESVLFFVGILLAVGALEKTGVLHTFASLLDLHVKIPGSSILPDGDQSVIILLFGFLSAIVDNVPLVAATMGMYHSPPDASRWQFIAYCAGTGGSMLVIGSAAGVAAMGMERITFGWYLRRIAPLALMGYLAGAITYWLMAPK